MSMATITHLHAWKTQSPEVTKSLCLQTGNSISNESSSNCFNCCNNYNFAEKTAEMANAPMPWIGLYVAGASLICTIAMAADLFLGFHNKKLWFPCKFFTLNAASLTLLAVAMKLPVDLSTSMPDKSDQIAKITSSVFICTVMGNFMPSLGQMNNKEIIMNVAALGILVVTIFVNLWIQLVIGLQYRLYSETLIMPVMLFLFLMMISSALYIPSTRKYIDLVYTEVHKSSSSEESEMVKKINADKLREDVKKYWMIAQTGSPQFVMARSVTCVAAGAFCVLIASFLVFYGILEYFYPVDGGFTFEHTSSYKWSTLVILAIQIIGIGVGTIACAFRVFTSIKLKLFLGLRGKGFKAEFRTEKYWIESLLEWKEKPLPLKIQSQKWKKLVHKMKNIFLCFCIWFQIMIVVVSKVIQFQIVFLIAPFLLCYHYCNRLKRKLIPNSSSSSSRSATIKIDLTRYVLRLEGENELPGRMLKNICDSVDRLIQMGKKQQPKNLKELLEKSTGFNGVAEFDKDQVPSLVSFEPPNSWMMPVVTLTSIAISLPNIPNRMVDGLQSSVSEGLIFMSLIENELDVNGDFVNIRNAAEVMWLGIELSRTWLDQDLRKMASKENNSKGTLEKLADIAKNIIVELNEKQNKVQKKNPLQWPVKAIAANSMYRISKTLMLDYDLGNELPDEELFKKLSVMISDILTACLTNLPRFITMKCFSSATEKREEGVQQAAHFLGETEEILKILQQRELPSLNQDQAACIDEWRIIIKQENNLVYASSSSSSSSNNDTFYSGSGEIHIAVEQEAC